MRAEGPRPGAPLFTIGTHSVHSQAVTVKLSDVYNGLDVEDVKRMLQDKEGIPPTSSSSFSKVGSWRTACPLAHYGISPGTLLHVVLRLAGGKPVICLWAAQPTDVTVRLRLSRHWALSSLVPRPDEYYSGGGGGSGGAEGVAGTADTSGGKAGDGGGWTAGGREAAWRVRALPDGTLVHPGSGGREYAYLFWEALTEASAVAEEEPAVAGGGGGGGGCSTVAGGSCRDAMSPFPSLGPTPADLPLPDFHPARSFCVAGADVERWLYDALAAFGLPVRERTDFLTYLLAAAHGGRGVAADQVCWPV
ncbi:hypothetical protein HYH02_004862 [Chlamydomonas schloesseri]|uniref:Ubiquitin-like domain-containing protein n=1 Tax=Chlamydomonas schloesseri TaxID=2026947 RepID=A0A835WMH9_9CHLO|nr:hypothetical protein HYH02_004862 [Chlamydomonas schloesseri]|eukprot:KAG2450357.1 hypothetical protein HYH02_004862 [Chlamydomonas schloesseri]